MIVRMKDHGKSFWLLILMAAFPFTLAFAQTEQFKFKHLTTREGLPSNCVNSILKDKDGFMWFATDNGLARFDGYIFKSYVNNSDDSTSVSGNTINAIAEESGGNLLIATASGLNRVDRVTGRFTHFLTETVNPKSISNDVVNVIYKASDTIFWIGTNQGLNKFNSATDEFIPYLIDPDTLSSPANEVLSILIDNKNTFWVGTYSGLYHFDQLTNKFTLFELKPDWIYDYSKGWGEIIYCIFQDSYDNIWIGTHWYLFKYTNGNIKWIGPPKLITTDSTPNSNAIKAIVEDKTYGKSILWIATQGGLNKYEPEKKKFNHIMSQPDNPDDLRSWYLTSLWNDDAGQIWIGTKNKGVEVLNLKPNPFIHHPLKSKITLFSASSFLFDSEENLWVGVSDDGLMQIDQDLKFKDYYKFRRTDITGIQDACLIYYLFEDSKGNLWVGNRYPYGGLYILNADSRIFEPVVLDVKKGYPKISAKHPIFINSIRENQDGELWIATNYGLYKSNNNKNRKFRYVSCELNDTVILTFVNDLFIDGQQNMWLADDKIGLLVADGTDDDTLKFLHYGFNDSQLFKTAPGINCIFQDNHKSLWLGSSSGLYQVDRHLKKCVVVGKDDKLISGVSIYKIACDDHQNLWMNTNKGVVRFNPDGNSNYITKVFTTADRLVFNDSDEKAFYQSKGGRIFVGGKQGTGGGFYFFHSDSVKDNHSLPEVVLTDFRIKNESYVLDTVINCKRHITLKHNQNFFSFEFAALNFLNPEKNQYAYFLEGFEDDWSYSGNRRFANYTGVLPGDYTFRVKGSNNDGYWNEEGTFVHISILPPVWKTWWAYIIYGLVVAAVIYSILHYYLRRQRLLQNLALEYIETEKLKELDSLKTKFFTNISHEFRTPLTLILGPVQQLLTKINNQSDKQALSMVLQNARRLTDLVNQLLSLSKLESGNMKLQCTEVNIIEFVSNYVQSFESLATQNKISLNFLSDQKEILAYIDKEKISHVLNNLLSNAFKFTGEGGRVDVEVTPLPPYLCAIWP